MNPHYKNHLTIGFAGKRVHGSLNLIEHKLPDLFKAFDRCLKGAHLRFITGLADGADQIASSLYVKIYEKEFIERSRSMGAVLPFEEAFYRQTLTDQQTFEELYNRHCDQQLELDGRYLAGNRGKALQVKNLAYQQQGLVLAHLSDVFIAVAPYGRPDKMGGTIETILSVLGQKKPVVLLNLTDGQFYLYRALEDWFVEQKAINADGIADMLFREAASTKDVLDDHVYEGMVFRMRKTSWLWYERGFKGKKIRMNWPEPSVHNSLHKSLVTAMKILDKKAIHFQYQYRGGYILNYILGLCAIFLAVSSSVILLEEKFLIREVMHLILGLVGLCKLGILLLIIFNTRKINENGYNKKAIDYRYAAERIRVNTFMAILGFLRSPKPSLGNHSKKHFSQYRGEAIYQSVMAAPLSQSFKIVIRTADLKQYLDVFRREWIENQKRYHSNESARMEIMESRLEKIPAFFSWAVVGIVICDLVLGALLMRTKEGADVKLIESINFAIPVLLGLTAFLPALITTLNSINFQSEAHRLSVRSSLMCKELATQEEKISDALDGINENEQGSDYYKVLKVTDEVANLLTDEVAEWSLIYEKRVYEG